MENNLVELDKHITGTQNLLLGILLYLLLHHHHLLCQMDHHQKIAVEI